MSLFKKKTYTLDSFTSMERYVLNTCLELVTELDGIGDQYKKLYASVKENKLTKDQMKECSAFARWYHDLVVSQPNLSDTFGKTSFDSIVKELGNIEKDISKML